MRRTIKEFEEVCFNTLNEFLGDLFEALDNEEDDKEVIDGKIFSASVSIAMTINTLLEIDTDNYKHILTVCDIDLLEPIEAMLLESDINLSVASYVKELMRD